MYEVAMEVKKCKVCNAIYKTGVIVVDRDGKKIKRSDIYAGYGLCKEHA